MRHLLAAWQAFWFAPASLTNLGVGRIVIVAITLYLNGTGRFLRVGTADPSFWAPVRLVRALGIPQPSLDVMEWMAAASVVLLLAAGAGVFTRAALAIVFPLLLVQEALLNSLGKVSHGTIPLMFAFLFFALAPCDRAFSLSAMRRRARSAAASGTFGHPPVRESAYARWPLDLLFIDLAAFYCLAGLWKLRAGGLAWADGYTLQYYLLDKGAPLGEWLAPHLELCRIFSALVLVLQLGFPLGIAVRRLRPLLLGGGALFHLGTTLFLEITFWPVVALYAVFIPWTYLGRALARWSGLAQRRLAALYDGGCSLCIRSMSIVRDLDLAGTVRFVDLSDVAAAAEFPRVDPAAARAAMHVADRTGTVSVGFDAFRRLAWVLPAAWPALPLLYFPGVAAIGRRIYGRIAAHRETTSCPLQGAPTP